MKILTLILNLFLLLTLELNLLYLNASLILLLFEIYNKETFYIVFYLDVRKLFKRNLDFSLFFNNVVASNLCFSNILSASIVFYLCCFRLVLMLLLT